MTVATKNRGHCVMYAELQLVLSRSHNFLFKHRTYLFWNVSSSTDLKTRFHYGWEISRL